MKTLTVTRLRKQIESMELGEKIYINAVNLNINCIDYIRHQIFIGNIAPDMYIIKENVKHEFWNEYRSGCSIYPQNTYIKIR